MHLDRHPRASHGYPPGSCHLWRVRAYHLAPEAQLFSGMSTRRKAFSVSPSLSGLLACAQTHQKSLLPHSYGLWDTAHSHQTLQSAVFGHTQMWLGVCWFRWQSVEMLLDQNPQALSGRPPGSNTLWRGRINHLAHVAPLFRRLSARSEAFLEPLSSSGLLPCGWTHLKKGIVLLSSGWWDGRKIPRDQSLHCAEAFQRIVWHSCVTLTVQE